MQIVMGLKVNEYKGEMFKGLKKRHI
jgi:hypothetical protein